MKIYHHKDQYHVGNSWDHCIQVMNYSQLIMGVAEVDFEEDGDGTPLGRVPDQNMETSSTLDRELAVAENLDDKHDMTREVCISAGDEGPHPCEAHTTKPGDPRRGRLGHPYGAHRPPP